MSGSGQHGQIETLRRRIDDLDRRLLELLNERARCALWIGEIKRRMGRAVYDPGREAEVVRRAAEGNGGPLEDEAVRRLFERILDESRRLERTAGAPGGAGPATEE